MLTRFVRFAVDTRPIKLAVETNPLKFAVLTTDPKTIVDRYPTVPRPITVDVRFVANPMVEINPSVPSPITVLVSSVGSIKLLIY